MYLVQFTGRRRTMFRPLCTVSALSILSGCSLLFGEAGESAPPDASIGAIDAAPEEPYGEIVSISGDGDNIRPSVAFDGENFRVVWEAHVGNAEPALVGATLLTPLGAPAVIAQEVASASIAGSRDGLATTWITVDDKLAFRLLDENFSDGAPQILEESTNGVLRDPDIAARAQDIGVVWLEQVSLSEQVLWFSTMLTNSASLGEASELSSSAITPVVTQSNDGFLVAWTEVGNGAEPEHIAHVAEISPETQEVTTATISDNTSLALRPDVAQGQHGLAMVWENQAGAQRNIVFASFSEIGSPVQTRDISTPGNEATAPVIIASGEGFACAWQERRNGQTEVLFLTLDASGEPLHEAVQLSNGEGPASGVSIAIGNLSHTVVWQQGSTGARQIYARTFLR